MDMRVQSVRLKNRFFFGRPGNVLYLESVLQDLIRARGQSFPNLYLTLENLKFEGRAHNIGHAFIPVRKATPLLENLVLFLKSEGMPASLIECSEDASHADFVSKLPQVIHELMCWNVVFLFESGLDNLIQRLCLRLFLFMRDDLSISDVISYMGSSSWRDMDKDLDCFLRHVNPDDIRLQTFS
jgi:hypothetical protein